MIFFSEKRTSNFSTYLETLKKDEKTIYYPKLIGRDNDKEKGKGIRR